MKLILFDIDGTLIFHLKTHTFEDQYEYALHEVYGVNAKFDLSKFNGTVDRYNSWETVKQYGVSREVFLQKFPDYIEVMHQLLAQRGEKNALYQTIPTAVAFVDKIREHRDITVGVITGNAKRIAAWKLEHVKLDSYFPFGLYGDEADDRIELAGMVFAKAKKELGLDVKPDDITVIGDTIYDIRCGKAIGAHTIAVTTGFHSDPKVLAAELPDLLVDSLLDPSVLSLFSLKS